MGQRAVAVSPVFPGTSRGCPRSSMATKVKTPSVTFSGARPRPRPLAQVSTFTVRDVPPVFTSEQ